jgi:hypothetical protein
MEEGKRYWAQKDLEKQKLAMNLKKEIDAKKEEYKRNQKIDRLDWLQLGQSGLNYQLEQLNRQQSELAKKIATVEQEKQKNGEEIEKIRNELK